MNLIYVLLVFIIGVCLGQNSDIPKAPTVRQTSVPLKENNDNHHNGPIQDNKDTTKQNSNLKPNTSETVDPADKGATVSTTSLPTTMTSAPPVGIGSWSVKDDKGNVCILLKGEIAVRVVTDILKNISYLYPVPKNASSSGSCHPNEFIKFDLPNNSTLQLTFEKNATTSKFYLHAIEAHLFKEKVANETKYYSYLNKSLHLFENPADQSYYCARTEENLVAVETYIHVFLKVKDFQFQAFMNSSKSEFDTAVDCEPPHTPDVVPIVVGCALAILVILVLVAYLISRRRSQARGYLSM